LKLLIKSRTETRYCSLSNSLLTVLVFYQDMVTLDAVVDLWTMHSHMLKTTNSGPLVITHMLQRNNLAKSLLPRKLEPQLLLLLTSLHLTQLLFKMQLLNSQFLLLLKLIKLHSNTTMVESFHKDVELALITECFLLDMELMKPVLTTGKSRTLGETPGEKVDSLEFSEK